MDIETAVKYIPLGKAVVFLGAGFSSQLTASDGDTVPSVGKLSELFAERTGLSPKLPLDLTSREYLKNSTPERISEFVDLMQKKLRVAKFNSWHKALINANWRSIYTTNYDNCVEEIEREVKNGIRSISKYSPFTFFDASIPVVHLHGYINDLNFETYQDALLLTRAQYASYETRHQYWDFLQRDIEGASAIFFCGFSLSDWHIERILSNRKDIKEKSFFILTANSAENEELRLRLAEYGAISFEGIEAFTKTVAPFVKRERDVSAPQFVKILNDIPPLNESPAYAAEQVHFFGRHSLELSELNRAGSPPILVRREMTNDVVQAIEEGTRFHIIHAEMGDGKTLLGEMIVVDLLSRGWTVALLDDRNLQLDAAIRFCRTLGPKSLLAILESEISLRDLYKVAEAVADCQVSILYCCRSAYFDLAYDEKKLLAGRFSTWRIPAISPSEFNVLNAIYDRFGLWGDMQGRPLTSRRRYVLHECKGEFRSLSVGHLKQSRIISLLRTEVERISSIDGSLLNLLIISLIYSYIGRAPKVYIINKLISKYAYETGNREFYYGNYNIMFIQNGEYSVPSSIFSREVLRNIIKSSNICTALEDMYIKSSQFANHHFSELRREIMQYGALQRIIVNPDGTPDLRSIVDLYRSYSDSGVEHGNIHFWQQYSIALYVSGDYQLSQSRLDTAKSLARSLPVYDTYMLDHHQARLILVSRAKKPGDYTDHESAYTTAISIAISLISDPDRSSERDTFYLTEHFKDAFSGASLQIVRRSVILREKIDEFRSAVAGRQPNASVGSSLLKRTLSDIDKALASLG